MPVWDLRKLQIASESKAPGPLYLIVSDEHFLVSEALASLKTASVAEARSDFNCDLFFAAETSAADVRDVVQMLPMMAPRRLVIFRGVEQLKDKDWEQLDPIFETPVETTTFVLVTEKIDRRKKYFKKIYDVGVVVELKCPYENQVPVWIDYIVKKSGLTISKEAVQLIQQFIGANLSEINSEVLKLKAYLGPRTEICAQDVLQTVSQSRVDSVFELANAIGRGDREQAFICLAGLLEQGQSEIGALALITRHVRILASLSDGLNNGLSGGRLSTKAGIPQFFLQEYLGQVRNWDTVKIRRTLKSLIETDRALKSSSFSPHLWLENFILQTC